MSPKTQWRLSILAIIIGGYFLLNNLFIGIFSLSYVVNESEPTDVIFWRLFAFALLTVIGITFVYYGNRYRKKSKQSKAPQNSV